jgi:hypothetical protein
MTPTSHPGPRSAACGSELALLQLDAGELAADAATTLIAHAERCERCTAMLAEIRADRAALAGVTPMWAAPRRTVRVAWLAAPALLAAAGLVLFVALRRDAADAPGVLQDGVRVKGSGLSLEVFVRHAGQVRRARDGEDVTPGDALRFALRGHGAAHVAVLSRDGAGVASVYAPRTAVTLTARAHELPGAIELDATPGPERLIAIACATPFEVEPLRAALAVGEPLALPDGCQQAPFTLRKAPQEAR